MTWYRDWFGRDYLRVYPHRDEIEAKRQVAFVRKVLHLKKRGRILDLGCGSGRHAGELSRRGYNVTCLDLSTVLLTLAKEKVTSNGCCIKFVKADMRALPFNNTFDSVLSFFTTFGYFQTDDENLKTLLGIQDVLKPGGTFFLDYLNKNFVIDNLVPLDTWTDDGLKVTQERRYNVAEERVEKKIVLEDGDETREYFESVRLYTLDEMRRLISKTSLRLNTCFGDFSGNDFSLDSPRLILVGRKDKD